MSENDDLRKPLDPGTILNGEYIVRELASNGGGSCLLYDCIHEDSNGNQVNVYVKEFYPKELGGKIARNSEDKKTIEWGVVYLPTKCIGIHRFKKACVLLNSFFKDKKLGINTSYQQKTFDENGTCYNVVPKQYSGVPGDKYNKENKAKTIERILTLVRKLTVLVDKYHEKHYLHLDIKPTNYLVIEDAGDIIIQFFDLDSLVETDRNGYIKYGESITYSLGYCAPEIFYGNKRQVGPWTDIYSIGVVLLEMICGQIPSELYSNNNSDISKILDRELPKSRVFIDEKGNFINPAVQKKVRNILEKCLSRFINDRYKTAAELRKEIEEAIDLCTTPYIVTSIGSSIDSFVGREDIMAQMEDHFAKGLGTFIISGPGGIGKTCVAHEYWRRNQEKNEGKYNVGIYWDYSEVRGKKNMISELLSAVEIQNFDRYSNENAEDFEKKRLSKIRELLNKNDVLILLDNFDMPRNQEQANEYKELFKIIQNDYSNANIIITTRTNLKELSSGIFKGNTTQDDLGGLSFDQSFELFKENCGRDVSGQEESFKKLFEFEQENTKALHILSRLYGEDTHRYESIEDIYQNLIRRKSLGGRTVDFDKEETAEEALCHIYEIAELGDDDKKLLSIVYLFRRTDLNQEMIYRIYGDDDGDNLLNQIHKLTTAGWITKSDGSYFLHPLVKYVVERRINPGIDNFPELKPFEFYMYFTVESETIEGQTYLRGINPHFEEGDFIDKLVIPADLPQYKKFVRYRNNKLCGFISNPFSILNELQVEDSIFHFIGNSVSVDKNNKYYEAKNNSIFTKEDDEKYRGRTLLFKSVKESIPNDENISISVIEDFACRYNREKVLIIPKTVKSIRRQRHHWDKRSFSFGYYDENTDYSHSSFEKPILCFESLPEECDYESIPRGTQTVLFKRDDVDIVDGFVIDKRDRSIVINELIRDETITIPKSIRIVNDINYDEFIPHDLKLHKDVIRLGPRLPYMNPRSPGARPGFVNQFRGISMDEDGTYFIVRDNCLIFIKENQKGAVVYAWSKNAAPEEEWIDEIGPRSQYSINKKERIVIPKTIKFIDSGAFDHIDLDLIEFDGTIEQWNQIEKSPNWFGGFNSKLQKVVCSDGEVEIDKGIKE